MKVLIQDGSEWSEEDLRKNLQAHHLSFECGSSYAAMCMDRNGTLVTMIQGKDLDNVRMMVDLLTEEKGIFSTEYVKIHTVQ